jgi:hypothetical protein
VYVAGPAGGAPGGTFVKSNGAIYGTGTGNANANANANNAAGSGSAVYVQGGRYRNDTVMGFLDSGKSIAGGWNYPVITHDGTSGFLEAGQVNWHVFTAPGGGAPLSVERLSGPVKVSAYRSNEVPISLDAAAPTFTAGEKVYVKVEGNESDSTGTYSIRQGPFLLESGGTANEGEITKGSEQVDWYFFTAETPGAYSVMWEDTNEQAAAPHYNGDVKVSAYSYDATEIFPPTDNGYNDGDGVSIGTLAAGETIYVKAQGKVNGNGTYGIRYYAP